MRALLRLTAWGWALVALTAVGTVGWVLLVDGWYRERKGSTPYPSGAKSWALLVVAFPLLFFLAGQQVLSRSGRPVTRGDPASVGETRRGRRNRS